MVSGLFSWRPKLAKYNFKQSVVTIKSVASKIKVTLVVRFDMKISLKCRAGC